MKGFNPGKGTGMDGAFSKALVGNQKNLPEHLKAKIEAAPESPNKMVKKSPMKKMDPPKTQAKIKKMIVSGIEKNMDDRDIRNKINKMSSGNLDYTYDRKTKKVTIKKGNTTGFEGMNETDPDKG